MGNDKAVAITAALVSAYLKNRAAVADDIPQLAQHVPDLIRRIHNAFAQLPDAALPDLGIDRLDAEVGMEGVSSFAGYVAPVDALVPAVPIRDSVTDGHVACLECGMTFRSLRPHLVAAHGLRADVYRKKWGLAHDHPIVAPNYSRDRSAVAKKIGLGMGGRGSRPGQPRTRG
jgi:predicted transcriptional regulator